jgi:site-specific DNA-methyltransferase (adenine-specific)
MLKTYFKKDNFCLYQGDCLEIIKSFPDNYFDMVFADPPYFLSNGGFTVHAGKMVSVHKGKWDESKSAEEDFEFHKTWIKEVKRVIKPEGTIWISGTYHSIYQCGFALQLENYHILNDVSWFKPNASPNLSCRFLTASHETLIWARKDKKAKHYFNYDLMKNGDWSGDFIKKPNLQMRSVWSINPPKPYEKLYGKHPTQKPLELLKRCILASTAPNSLILDPFSGSSTTGIATMLCGENRKYIGIELDTQYLDLAIKRYNQIIDNPEVFDSTKTTTKKSSTAIKPNPKPKLNFEQELSALIPEKFKI